MQSEILTYEGEPHIRCKVPSFQSNVHLVQPLSASACFDATMDRPKQPRRFACDRCRIYKLRCERVSTEGNSCNRCIKFGIFCETTNAQGLGAKSKTTQRRSAHTFEV
ncbi:hypothetical protein F5X98DRAFT_115268 [Xylaria grammica]|nr:hypothetical protein F5X98DRAFT_115268 [Xylaria grammica]